MLYTEINVKSSRFLFLTSLESPLNKGGSEGVWKYRWLHNFLISTNGGNGVSCHPDRETIANIVCYAKRDVSKPVHLYFNYPIKEIEEIGYKFIEESEVKQYNIVIHENVLGIEK